MNKNNRRGFLRAVAGLVAGAPLARHVAAPAPDLASMRLQVEDVARVFNVPIRMLADVGSVGTYSAAERYRRAFGAAYGITYYEIDSVDASALLEGKLRDAGLGDG